MAKAAATSISPPESANVVDDPAQGSILSTTDVSGKGAGSDAKNAITPTKAAIAL